MTLWSRALTASDLGWFCLLLVAVAVAVSLLVPPRPR